MATLAERVRIERVRRGWTQTDLARRSAVRRAYIAQLECGQRTTLPLPHVIRIAQTLEVDLNYLVGLTSKKEMSCVI